MMSETTTLSDDVAAILAAHHVASTVVCLACNGSGIGELHGYEVRCWHCGGRGFVSDCDDEFAAVAEDAP